jgi:hypothetical protein
MSMRAPFPYPSWLLGKSHADKPAYLGAKTSLGHQVAAGAPQDHRQ